MRKLILIRAHSTAWENTQDDLQGPLADHRRLQGTVPLPLSDQDKKYLDKIADSIIKQETSDLIYSSGNESSGSTAARLARICNLKARKIPQLKELDCGLWQGLQIKEIKRRFASSYKQWRQDPTVVCPPGGEPIETAWERVQQAMELLLRKNRGKTVILVAAPIISALVECVLTKKDITEFWSVFERNSTVIIFEQQGNGEYCVKSTQSRQQIQQYEFTQSCTHHD